MLTFFSHLIPSPKSVNCRPHILSFLYNPGFNFSFLSLHPPDAPIGMSNPFLLYFVDLFSSSSPGKEDLTDVRVLKVQLLPSNHLSVTKSRSLYKHLVFTPCCCNYIISFNLQETHLKQYEWNIGSVNIDYIIQMQRILSYLPNITKQSNGYIYFLYLRSTFYYQIVSPKLVALPTGLLPHLPRYIQTGWCQKKKRVQADNLAQEL